MRSAILDGDLAPEDLVKLSPNELATEEQKDARDAESKASTLERRADYYQIARAGIQVELCSIIFLWIPTCPLFLHVYCHVLSCTLPWNDAIARTKWEANFMK